MDRRLNFISMPFPPNMIYRFDAIPIKIPASYFIGIYKLILKFTRRGKRPRIANTILEEKNKVERLMLPNFKTCDKAIVIKTLCYGQKNRYVGGTEKGAQK